MGMDPFGTPVKYSGFSVYSFLEIFLRSKLAPKQDFYKGFPLQNEAILENRDWGFPEPPPLSEELYALIESNWDTQIEIPIVRNRLSETHCFPLKKQ